MYSLWPALAYLGGAGALVWLVGMAWLLVENESAEKRRRHIIRVIDRLLHGEK